MQSKQLSSVLPVLLVASLLIAACGGRPNRQDTVAANRSQPSEANQEQAPINVTLREMEVVLDQPQAPAGMVTFVVQNAGYAPHDFAIQGNGVEAKTPLLEPGQSASLTVDLSAGEYEYVCMVPGHAIAGMRGTLRVT